QVLNLNQATDVGLIDLGIASDTVNLTTAGLTYSFGLAGVETLNGTTGDDSVRLSAATGVQSFNLGGGTDAVILTDANGTYQLGTTSVETMASEDSGNTVLS